MLWFLQIEGRTLPPHKDYDSLYCKALFAAAFWKQTRSISEVCLCICMALFLILYFKSGNSEWMLYFERRVKTYRFMYSPNEHNIFCTCNYICLCVFFLGHFYLVLLFSLPGILELSEWSGNSNYQVKFSPNSWSKGIF